MKNKTILLLIVGLFSSPSLFSQIKFSLQPEIGINSSGTPNKNKYIVAWRNDHVTETYMPLVRPLFGLWTKINFGKHFFINPGFQYLWVGDRYHYHRDGNNLVDHTTYTSDNWENQTFQKISIPVSIGFDFRIKKIRPGIFIGFRENYYTRGRYYTKKAFIQENHPDQHYEEQLNPFDKKQFSRPAPNWNWGFFIGLGVDITKKINLNLSYSANQKIIYGSTSDIEGSFGSYWNDDISLTIKYTLK